MFRWCIKKRTTINYRELLMIRLKQERRNWYTLREKCPDTEFFWSVFSIFKLNTGKYGLEKLRIWTLFRRDTPLLFWTKYDNPYVLELNNQMNLLKWSSLILRKVLSKMQIHSMIVANLIYLNVFPHVTKRMLLT